MCFHNPISPKNDRCWFDLNYGEQVLLKLPFLRILHREPGSAHLNSPHVASHSKHIAIIIKPKYVRKIISVFFAKSFHNSGG